MSLQVVSSTAIDDIANWVCAGKLKRTDILQDAREAALDFYKVLCKKVPFDSLRETSAEYNFIAAQNYYVVNDYISTQELSQVAGICSIRVTYASGKFRRLRRSHVRVYDSLGSETQGIPSTYARWGGIIYVNPTPSSAAYSFRLRYWRTPTMNTGDDLGATVLVTPPEWDELIKWETLYRMYLHLDEFDKAQALVNPVPMPRQSSSKKTVMFETAIIPRLWNDLLLTIDQREGVDEDFSINPVVRPYTY